MNIDILGKFFLGNGGVGDALIFLSTFYDDIEEANVIFLANQPESIIELLSLFPKIKKKLVLPNDFSNLKEFYYHPNCIGTGILPKDLNYQNWYKVDIFKEYGVKEFPDFINLFQPKRFSEKQLFIQYQGSSNEGEGKKRILGVKAMQEISKYIDIGYFVNKPEIFSSKGSIKEIFETIRGSDVLIGVDSFAKTFSAMCKIKTIVYDNIYTNEYLNRFKNRIDYGHYIFLFDWKYIELRQQYI